MQVISTWSTRPSEIAMNGRNGLPFRMMFHTTKCTHRADLSEATEDTTAETIFSQSNLIVYVFGWTVYVRRLHGLPIALLFFRTLLRLPTILSECAEDLSERNYKHIWAQHGLGYWISTKRRPNERAHKYTTYTFDARRIDIRTGSKHFHECEWNTWSQSMMAYISAWVWMCR